MMEGMCRVKMKRDLWIVSLLSKSSSTLGGTSGSNSCRACSGLLGRSMAGREREKAMYTRFNEGTALHCLGGMVQS